MHFLTGDAADNFQGDPCSRPYIYEQGLPVPFFFPERQEQLAGWARTSRVSSYVWRPTTVDEIREVLSLARTHGRTIVLRGGGHSYADTALNSEGITLDLSRMRRVLEWDPRLGTIRVEPGVTIEDLWRATIADGWWPTVAPTSMGATLGGCLALNVHGKNAWKKGSIGEHVIAIELLTAAGDLLTVTPGSNPDLFHAVIGGLGMIGVITSITLQLRPISSGMLRLRHRSARALSEMFTIFAEEALTADYLEGWIDGYAGGRDLGRGFVRCASFAEEPDHSSLRPQAQVTRDIISMLPIEFLGRALQPFLDSGNRVRNSFLYRQAVSLESRQPGHLPLVQFLLHADGAFKGLHALMPHGFHSFQPIVPAEHAYAVFNELFQRSHRAGILPIWCIFKKQRPTPFLLNYQLDGFSLELNYPVTRRNAKSLALLLTEMREVVIAAGGRFHLAKDSILDAASFAQSMGTEPIERFLAIKQAYDPEGLFSSDMFRRIVGQP